eukprot:jgi/Chrpa1/20764/Chrysochromulina_OHIO_Genome00006986-RA
MPLDKGAHPVVGVPQLYVHGSQSNPSGAYERLEDDPPATVVVGVPAAKDGSRCFVLSVAGILMVEALLAFGYAQSSIPACPPPPVFRRSPSPPEPVKLVAVENGPPEVKELEEKVLAKVFDDEHEVSLRAAAAWTSANEQSKAAIEAAKSVVAAAAESVKEKSKATLPTPPPTTDCADVATRAARCGLTSLVTEGLCWTGVVVGFIPAVGTTAALAPACLAADALACIAVASACRRRLVDGNDELDTNAAIQVAAVPPPCRPREQGGDQLLFKRIALLLALAALIVLLIGTALAVLRRLAAPDAAGNEPWSLQAGRRRVSGLGMGGASAVPAGSQLLLVATPMSPFDDGLPMGTVTLVKPPAAPPSITPPLAAPPSVTPPSATLFLTMPSPPALAQRVMPGLQHTAAAPSRAGGAAEAAAVGADGSRTSGTDAATGSVITSAIPGSVTSPWRSTRPETSEWETDDSRFASWIRRAARGGRVETSETDEERHASRAERAELGESASGWETDDDRYPGWLLDADRLCKTSRALLAPDGADAVAPNAVAAMVTVGAAASAAARPPSACTPSPRGLLRRT